MTSLVASFCFDLSWKADKWYRTYAFINMTNECGEKAYFEPVSTRCDWTKVTNYMITAPPFQILASCASQWNGCVAGRKFEIVHHSQMSVWQVASYKLQVASYKLQVASNKLKVLSCNTPAVATCEVRAIVCLTLNYSPATSVLVPSSLAVCVCTPPDWIWAVYTYRTGLTRTRKIFYSY